MEMMKTPQNNQTNRNNFGGKTPRSPLKLLLLLGAAIFLIEGVIMDLLYPLVENYGLAGHHMLIAMLDASFLTVLVFPVLYFFHYKPLATFISRLSLTHFRLAEARKLASIARLSAGLAHEIKNPLNIIALAAQTLMMDDNLEAETKETLRTVVEQTNRASLIIDKLRVFASSPPEAVFDLREYLADAAKQAVDEMAEHGVAILADVPESPIMLRGNGDHLCEVCQSLLSNARDSVIERMEAAKRPGEGSEQNGWRPAITISARTAEGKAVISVEDTGTGIRETDMEKIFDPFFSTKPEGKGAGLGLATARGLVESHGGTIDVESVFGKGAVFTVTLPLAE